MHWAKKENRVKKTKTKRLITTLDKSSILSRFQKNHWRKRIRENTDKPAKQNELKSPGHNRKEQGEHHVGYGSARKPVDTHNVSLTEREERTGRISDRGVDSTDRVLILGSLSKDDGNNNATKQSV